MGVFQVIPEDNLVLFDEHGEMSQQEHGRGTSWKTSGFGATVDTRSADRHLRVVLCHDHVLQL